MIITSCEASFFDLPLLVPLSSGNYNLLSRRGFIISFNDKYHHCGYGEVAPYPGLHSENLEAVLAQYRELRFELIGHELSAGLSQLDGGFEYWLGQFDLFPSLRYGIEMAALNLLACQKGCTLAGLLASSYTKLLPVNGLLWLRPGTDIGSQLEELSALGFTSVKLKVARQSLQEDIAALRTARRLLGNTMSLRLDANRSWDLETAIRFGKAVAALDIEYIEEPLADPAQLPEFHASTTIPVALDESLINQSPSSITVPECVDALVLKPAVLGGFERMKAYILLARQLGVKAIISSVFDSGVGLAALANCAASLTDGQHPAGLDTYRWLRDDVLVARFDGYGATVDVDRVYSLARYLRPALLSKVT